MPRIRALPMAIFCLLAVTGPPSRAAVAAPSAASTPCRNSEPFEHWVTAFRDEAARQGISRKTIAAALDGMTLAPDIIARDRRQGFYWQPFLQFCDRLATSDRIRSGARQIEAHRALFDRTERDYGVPAAVVAAFWALESDYGRAMGKEPVLRSLATLAYDCRRGEMFRGELLAALKIIDRGDLRPSEMIGAWAGEIGQTQFLPSHYDRHAVDYDGDGRRDLIHSAADVVASTSAFIASFGWRRGEPWLEEVRVPADLPWQEADPELTHPREFWSRAGVLRAGGAALPADQVAVALLLPMGRNGPAFLAYPNFQAYLKWNQSLNYALTAAYLATRIAGAPAMNRGRGAVPSMSTEQVQRLQTLLAANGYPAGPADGKLGAATRVAVRRAQLKFGLPADSYPTLELLNKLANPK